MKAFWIVLGRARPHGMGFWQEFSNFQNAESWASANSKLTATVTLLGWSDRLGAYVPLHQWRNAETVPLVQGEAIEP